MRPVALIVHADTDAGFQLAARLASRGVRVAVAAYHPASLSRILLGRSAEDVVAIAADVGDASQYRRLLARVQERFGPISVVLDGRTGAPWACGDDLLALAS
jgi:NAD(P)-dependent dehydrogenase (short-subunit alcohol dehydrogenase family)